MAELFLAKGFPEPDSLGVLLRDALPDDFFVVADPSVHGLAFDAVVVGPQGVFTLQAKHWEGHITAARSGPWLGSMPSGQPVSYPNPAQDIRQAGRALRAFMRDEFSSLRLPVYHFLVLVSPQASLSPTGVLAPEVVTKAGLPDAISSTPVPFKGAPLAVDVREEVALALRDRQLTASQRASVPFVFRRGGLFSTGKKAWTIRAAVRHIDRDPEDGLYYLRNGTLAAWLSGQGAEHLAKLARDAIQLSGSDPRAVVETFLIRTGLVRRPRLVVRPRRLYLGPVLSGENCEARLKVRKGGGRGYLFGKVHTSEPWLRVEPASFRERLDAIVSADTESLPISHTPWQAQILVESTSTDEPIPVRVRVVAMPSTLNRTLLRPLAGALAAGLIGAGVGAALGAAGLAVPAWVARRLAAEPAPVLFWAAAFWVVWAVLGALRGQKQPRHWPVSYAAARWLLRLAAWGIALAALAALGQWTWTHFGPLEAATSGPSVEIVALLGLALSILPATLAEVRLGRSSGVVPSPSRRRPGRRTFLLLFGLALALCVVLGVPLLGRAWQGTDVNRAIVSAQQWATSRWSQAETKAGEWMDRLFLRYYDRRAPASTPTPLHTATPPSATTPLQSTTPAPALTPVPPTLAPAPTLEGLTP